MYFANVYSTVDACTYLKLIIYVDIATNMITISFVRGSDYTQITNCYYTCILQ